MPRKTVGRLTFQIRPRSQLILVLVVPPGLVTGPNSSFNERAVPQNLGFSQWFGPRQFLSKNCWATYLLESASIWVDLDAHATLARSWAELLAPRSADVPQTYAFSLCLGPPAISTKTVGRLTLRFSPRLGPTLAYIAGPPRSPPPLCRPPCLQTPGVDSFQVAGPPERPLSNIRVLPMFWPSAALLR